MSIGIGSNLPSSTSASRAVDQSFEKISSGKQINSAADDAAGLAISTQFSAQSRGQTQAIRNAGDGISLAQTAGGALSSLTENVQRIRELSVQAANGTLNDSDRELLGKEVTSLTEQIQDTLKNTNFNGKNLFDSNDSQTYQVGPNNGDVIDVEGKNLVDQIEQEGLSQISVNSQEDASATIEIADNLLSTLSANAADYGALQNRFESRIDTLEQDRIASETARSRIEDADIAKVASQLSADQIREQVSIAVQAQSNQNQGNVLALLQT
jgi:flagellin